MKIDLHIHTLESDGDFSPEEIIEKSAKAGIKTIAITDHDAVSGIESAIKAGQELGVRVISGVEINCGKFHILGYFIDSKNSELLEFASLKKAKEAEQLERMIKILQEEGFEISVEEVKKLVKCKKVEEKEIASALAKRGYAEFKGDIYKAKDALKLQFWLHVSKDQPIDIDVGDAIKLIKGASGIPFWAHPFAKIKDKKAIEYLVKKLKQKGIQGIEAFNPECQTPQQTKILLQLAKKYDLLVTGGTDFHYKKDKVGTEIPDKYLNWVLK